MKVTVTFGDTPVVVPCKSGWTVRDLIDQATRRYRKILDQHGRRAIHTHHLEYTDGGILDIDDLLTELVEDRDKLVAVFEAQRGITDSPGEGVSNGDSSAAPSPEPLNYYSHLQLQEPTKGEIEVNEAALKSNTPLLVRSSSESALAPPIETTTARSDRSDGGFKTETNNVMKGGPEQPAKMSNITFSTLTRTVNLVGDRERLGIQVTPYCSSLSGRTLGLLIENIEENSRTKRENILQENECIVYINGTPLQDKTFADSQEVFRQALSSPSMHLEVVPVANKPRYEKGLIGQLFAGDGKDSKAMVTRAKTDLQAVTKQDTKPNPVVGRQDAGAKTPEPPLLNPAPVAANLLSADARSRNASSERTSPTPAVRTTISSSSPPRTRTQSPPTNKSSVVPDPADLPNKKGGKRIKIDLKKGAEGLGFTVVTRESSSNEPGPILVKNILPRGAAIKNGRLQPGDRILEVNGMDLTGRTQEELVAMLRGTRQGESVCLVVARQDDIFLPRELKGEDSSSLVLEDGREQLLYEIPLNETGSAGLGVSLKGNKSRETGEDLGIFIKSIIHGGAAYKDGRLRVNDQLMAVNGEALLGRSNHAAMETLRRSMSSEGNARGTIQLVLLRASGAEEPQGRRAYQGASRPSELDGTSLRDKYVSGGSGGALHPAATTNGHYDNNQYSTTVGEMTRDPGLNPSQYSKAPTDDVSRYRASKSMDLVADESNVRSLVGHQNEYTTGGTLGPTLGLWKSSSLESLQSAMSEAQQNHIKVVPFHRPRPTMVRGRACNQSFRMAIDKSYEGHSEDDDDPSEQSSDHEAPASGSSRQDLDVEDGTKSKKDNGRKQEKKSKAKKKREEAAEDLDKKTKKKGFALLRFGKKKEDKSRDALKVARNKLEALSEEDIDKFPDHRERYDPRYAEINFDQVAPEPGCPPDVEDDDVDPNYARIISFRQPDSPHLIGRTHSPGAPVASGRAQAPADLDGLYAKVVKPRQPSAESDGRPQGMRREYQQARAAPAYEELDAARRRVLEHDPRRVTPRGTETRPFHLYEEMDPPRPTGNRRDPYDYPSHSRSAYRDYYEDVSPPSNRRQYPASPRAGEQYRVALRQDVPESPTEGRRGRPYSEAVRGRGDGYRTASPGRYASPERYGYAEERQPDPRRKNPIGAV